MLVNQFNERDCGCILRGDGQWLRMCQQHGLAHRQQLFAKYPGLNRDGSVKRKRGEGHTRKTGGINAKLREERVRQRSIEANK